MNYFSEVIMESLNASEDGCGVFDQSDHLMYCNQAFENGFCLQTKDALGKSFEEILLIFHASGCGVIANNGDVEGMVKRALAGRRKPWFSSFVNKWANGDWVKVSRLRTHNDYIVTYASNIDKLKETEKDLK